jgi:putative two-component system response regulator
MGPSDWMTLLQRQGYSVIEAGSGKTPIETCPYLKSYLDEQAESVVLSLAQTIESRNPRMKGHSNRVSENAVQFGRILGLSETDLAALHLSSLLHDIGKVAVPDAILFKPAKLTAEETSIMRLHPITGEAICSPLKSFHHVLPIIRHHHERFDGSGYPDHLIGDAIPCAARILQIADIFDALTSDRPYRSALSRENAIAILEEEAAAEKLDKHLVNEYSSFFRNLSMNSSRRGLLGANLVH